MARTAEKLESLITDNPDIHEALAVVLEHIEGDDNEIEWSDVRDELSSGQWGRLIQTGILVDGDTGFKLAEPAVVRDVFEERGDVPIGTTDPDEADDVQWTTWDKAAAGGSIMMFAGYSLPSVRDAIGQTIDVLLGPVDALLPFYIVIMVLALLTGLYSTLLQANLMNMDKMSVYQQRMKDIQRRQKEAKERGDDEELERIREEQMSAMGDQLGMFKVQLRPMVWIMLFTIPVFLWMYWMILDGHVAQLEQQIIVPLVGAATWQQGLLGPIQLWIVWYFLCSMAFTQVVRKALNIQTTPT